MSRSKWSAEKTWKFVMEYRARECLWNTKLVAYKDRQLKDAAYSQLAEMFQAGVNDIKIKIKNLRTTYIQEHKKILESVRAHQKGQAELIYQPSLVWYKEMDSFLRYTSSVGKITPVDVVFENNDLDGVEFIKEEPVEIQLENGDLLNSLERLQPKSEPKKRKQPEPHHVQQTPTVSLNKEKFEEHEFDIFGKSVAKQLKSFSSIAAALRVQSKIQSLLTEERIQDQIAASDSVSRRRNNANQRFFYNQGSSDSSWSDTQNGTEVIAVVIPSSPTNQEISNLSKDASLLDGSREFEVAFLD